MRKFLVIAMLLLASMTYGQTWHGLSKSEPSTMKTTLVSSSENQIVVKLEVPGFYESTVTTPRGEASVISVPRTVSTFGAGEPALPVYGIPAIIDDNANMKVYVRDMKYTDYENMEIAPSKGDFPRTIDPATVPYTYGEAYDKDEFFPSMQVGLYEPYIIRDLRGQNMITYPFAYNPVTKTLRVYTEMTLVMYKSGIGGANQIENRRSNTLKLDPDFKDLYSRHFINFEESMSKYTPLDEEGDMLIICYDNFISSMTDFVNWKKTRGVKTTIVGTSTAGSTYSAIKSYIQSQYNANNNLTHVLLVGDVAQIPGYTYSGGGSSYAGKGDNAYGQIVGNDIYNDVIIGRFSASNTTRVATQVKRSIEYERDMTTSASWLQKGVGISRKENGSGHNNEDDYQHINNIRTDLLNYGYTSVTQRYANLSGYDGSSSTISSDINSGAGIINYANHGLETAWGANASGYIYYTNSHVNALTNNNKLPFIFSVACLVGKYDHSSDCFAEAWMNATNNNNPTGAIGTLMSYISQPWIPPMWAQDECVDILVESYSNNKKHSFGGISINGLMGIFDHYSTSDQSAVGTYQAWIVYGDPSLMVRTKTPQAMTVTHDCLDESATSFTVSVNNGDGAMVCLTNDYEIVARATVTNGSATLNFTPIGGSHGTMRLCVFGYNKVTYLTELCTVSGGASEYTINVSANPTNGGTVTGGGTFSAGTTRTVTATAKTGYTFSNWTENGSVVSTNASYSFTLNYNRNLVANFAVKSYTVNAEANPAEGGSVALAQGGKGNRATLTYDFENGIGDWTILKGNTGTSSHNWMHNSEYPTSNNDFSSGYGHNNSDGFMLSESYISGSSNSSGSAVTPDNYLVSPQVALGGSISFYAGARNTSYCAEKFSVMVSTTNNTNTASFTTVATYTLSLSSAGYTSSPYTIDLSAYSGMGYIAIRHHDCYDQWFLCIDDVTIVEGEYVDPSTATGTFTHGQTCVATATPNTGYNFVNWTENGSAVSSNATYSFVVTSNRNLVANFSNQTQTYTVNVSANPTAGGTVNGGGTYSQGQSCTVTATANTGYTFTNWTENGSVVSTNASYTFTVNSNRNLVANFSQQQTQTYTVTLNSGTGGTINPSGTQTVNDGGSLTFTVSTFECYQIASVTVNGTAVTLNASNSYTITNIHANQTVNVTYTYDDSCADCNVYNEFSATACDSYTWNGQTYTTSGDYVQTFPISGGGEDPGIVGDEFFYDFESSPTDDELSNWMIVDADGDGNNWGIFNSGGSGYGHNSSESFLGSYSYYSGSALTPDNWIIMPQVALGSTSTLSFYACGLDPNYPAEYFGVYIATTANLTSTADFTELNAWTATGEWTQYTVDLSAYAGQDAYLAFRHYNVTDMYILLIDDISLSNGTAKAFGLTAAANANRNETVLTTVANIHSINLINNGVVKAEPTRDCDSVVTLHLTINHSESSEVTVTECDSYTWHNQTYTTSGNYTYTGTTANGCTLTETLHLTINNSESNEVTVTECDSYTWHNQTYTTSGNYTYTGTTAAGCTLTETLHLTINHGESNEFTVTECDSYTWHNQNYTTSGNYTYTGTTAAGCTLTETLHLTINQSESEEFTETACDSYTWHNQNYTTSGDYTYTGTTAAGCTLTETLHLTINQSESVEFTETACDSYTWHGQTYTENGDYTYTGTTAAGCTLTETLHLYISAGEPVDIYETACDSYTWHGETYTESGEYTFENQSTDCSFTETLHLTINTAAEVTIDGVTEITLGDETTLTASEGASYEWSTGETTQSITVAPTEITTYTVTVTDANGCVASAEITVMPTEGIVETTPSVKVYPNPVNNVVNIEADGITNIRVVDLLGQTLYETNASSNKVQIDLSGYTVGQYFLEVRTQNGIAIEKVVRK